MVLIQVDLSDKASKKLKLYSIYANVNDQRSAIEHMILNFDLNDVRDDFLKEEGE